MIPREFARAQDRKQKSRRRRQGRRVDERGCGQSYIFSTDISLRYFLHCQIYTFISCSPPSHLNPASHVSLDTRAWRLDSANPLLGLGDFAASLADTCPINSTTCVYHVLSGSHSVPIHPSHFHWPPAASIAAPYPGLLSQPPNAAELSTTHNTPQPARVCAVIEQFSRNLTIPR